MCPSRRFVLAAVAAAFCLLAAITVDARREFGRRHGRQRVSFFVLF